MHKAKNDWNAMFKCECQNSLAISTTCSNFWDELCENRNLKIFRSIQIAECKLGAIFPSNNVIWISMSLDYREKRIVFTPLTNPEIRREFTTGLKKGT